MPKFNEYLVEAEQPDFSADPKFQEKMKDFLSSRKPKPDSLLSFKTIDGKEWLLALVADKSFGGFHPKWGYVTKDKKLFSTGTYSGGVTGGGVSDYIKKVGVEDYGDLLYFIKWFK